MKYYRPDEDKSSYSKHHKGKIEDYDMDYDIVDDTLLLVNEISIIILITNNINIYTAKFGNNIFL